MVLVPFVGSMTVKRTDSRGAPCSHTHIREPFTTVLRQFDEEGLTFSQMSVIHSHADMQIHQMLHHQQPQAIIMEKTMIFPSNDSDITNPLTSTQTAVVAPCALSALGNGQVGWHHSMLAPQPCFPKQQQVVDFVQEHLLGKKSYDHPFKPGWLKQGTTEMQDKDWITICDNFEYNRRSSKARQKRENQQS